MPKELLDMQVTLSSKMGIPLPSNYHQTNKKLSNLIQKS